MKLQVYVGPQGVGFEFETTEERDRFFDGLGRNPSATGFTPQQAASKLGPNAIKIDPAKMKVGYKWPLQSVPMPVTVPRSNGRVSSEMPPPRTPARVEKTVTQLPPQIPIAPVVVLNPGSSPPPSAPQQSTPPPALIPMPEVSEVPKEEPKAEMPEPVQPPTDPAALVKRGPGRPRKNT